MGYRVIAVETELIQWPLCLQTPPGDRPAAWPRMWRPGTPRRTWDAP